MSLNLACFPLLPHSIGKALHILLVNQPVCSWGTDFLKSKSDDQFRQDQISRGYKNGQLHLVGETDDHDSVEALSHVAVCESL